MNDSKGPSETKARRIALSPHQQQTADYIADMAVELSGMAEQAGLPLLRDMIETVADEAMRELGRPSRRRSVNSPSVGRGSVLVANRRTES